MEHHDIIKQMQSAAAQVKPRNYANPGARPPEGKLVDSVIDVTHAFYQYVLDHTEGGIPARIRLLHAIQRENQYIQDRLAKLERRRVTAKDCGKFLLIQSNPERLNRSQPAKRQPPQGIALKGQPDLACFIDPRNILWQQAGLQFPYPLVVAGQRVVLAVNPYPLGRFHTSVIWQDGSKQDWKSEDELLEIVNVMLALAMSNSKYIVFYNGMAGASIPDWKHAHVFELDDCERPLPCQHAAACVAEERGKSEILIVDQRHHPIPLYRFAGPDAAANVLRTASLWHGCVEDATENLVVLTENSGPVIYMALRQRGLVKATGLAGDIASLEVAGQLVMSTENEIRKVREDSWSYEDLASVLRDVTPWRAFELFARPLAA